MNDYVGRHRSTAMTDQTYRMTRYIGKHRREVTS